MRNNRLVLATLAALIGGFGLGNVLAETGARLKFDGSDLYAAATRLHRDNKRDFLFANASPRARTFEVDASSIEDSIRGIARAFDKKSSVVANVVVFEDGMKERATAMERIDELNTWLLANFPASEGRRKMGQSDAFRVFLLATRADAKTLSKGLGPGTQKSFGDLTPQEQQAALDLARAARWSYAATDMASLLDQWNMVVRSRR